MDSQTSLRQLLGFCENQSFKGWDPYDGLNSKLFKSTPFNKSAFIRLAWIQLFKRNPINLRNLVGIDKGYNPKGLALFISGYYKLYLSEKNEIYLNKIKFLAEKLISLQSQGYSGACWGYNFDWQARGELYFPSGTPTIVATAFCASALFDAYEITRNDQYLSVALSSAEFIINDLKRTHKPRGFLFSYAPLSGNNTVYNASLMGSKILSKCFYYTKNSDYAELANKSVMACVDAQNMDGSWKYGELPVQKWIDSFHTGYNLECIKAYEDYCNDTQYRKSIQRGLDYYIENFFLGNGVPKYYNNKIYPIDIHCPAQLFVTLSNLNAFSKYRDVAEAVLNWSIRNMQDQKGYFYYQKHKKYTIKIPYMRWSQAFMFYGMSHYLYEFAKINN